MDISTTMLTQEQFFNYTINSIIQLGIEMLEIYFIMKKVIIIIKKQCDAQMSFEVFLKWAYYIFCTSTKITPKSPYPVTVK